MIARTTTVAFQGINALTVDVQVQMGPGNVIFNIVGLPDKAIGESRERVRSALHSIGLGLPLKRITVNLSPADLQKEGSHYDLPIALGVLVAMEVLSAEEMSQYLALGELALDGRLTAISGVLPAAIHAAGQGLGLICPESCGSEAAWAQDIDILAPPDLLSLINHFKGTQVLDAPQPRMTEVVPQSRDLKDVKGQETPKRALEIAAAGGHNLLMLGPPGSGKSMLASRLVQLLPPLEPAEALEVTMIHSIAGQLEEGRLIRERPYRDPHHSASLPALVGGSAQAKPGEVSLAHRGVLFLDELPEFARGTLEALRQPIENGNVTVSRANAHVTYPARFQLVAAMNPCRCGYLDDAERACSRAPKCAMDYQAKISGPLFDRMDLVVHVPEVRATDLVGTGEGESSEVILGRVQRARDRQRVRLKGLEGVDSIGSNAEIQGALLEQLIPLDPESRALMEEASEKFKLSARGYYRVLRVARTIADLGESGDVRREHLAEALSFRRI